MLKVLNVSHRAAHAPIGIKQNTQVGFVQQQNGKDLVKWPPEKKNYIRVIIEDVQAYRWGAAYGNQLHTWCVRYVEMK